MFKTYEDALTKALQVEMDEDFPAYPTDTRLKEQLEFMQKSLKELNLKIQDVWCTKCSTTGHSKDNYRQDVRFVQIKCFCDIYQEHGEHKTKDCSFNMKNGKESWCAICEVKIHAMADCHLNLKNQQNSQAVYQTNTIAQNNYQQNNAQNEQNNQRYEGRRYEHRFDN